MSIPISDIRWTDGTEALDKLLGEAGALTVHRMNQGFEAEVARIDSREGRFVLKIWSEGSRPDVGCQYRLLTALGERGIAVPKALGWGMTPDGHQALLTAYGGEGVAKANAATMTRLAFLLADIHRIPIEAIGNVELPRRELVGYFFPGIEAHPDLGEALHRLLACVSGVPERIIHGDYHLQNIVEQNGELTIIDWTNGQAGDYRYDFAWSLVLLRLYSSERLAAAFRTAYLKENPIPEKDLRLFEGIAFLRWMLLYRSGAVPLLPATLARARKIAAKEQMRL
ncbi:phosphotransferase family protein [Cohnella hongkongensis]|uniref:Phosphotransferase family protein n=1 Tax=Cohnella hongkongensis TaxID=178337 RepID=A0ABV9FD64_9BACL